MERLDEISFEASLNYMATLHHELGGNVIFVKGSPESVVAKCVYVQAGGKAEPIDRNAIFKEAHEMAGQALRVLAVAMKSSHEGSLDQKDVSYRTMLDLIGVGPTSTPNISGLGGIMILAPVLGPLLYAGANASTTVPFIRVRASFFLSVRSFSDIPSPTRRHQPSTTASCSAAS